MSEVEQQEVAELEAPAEGVDVQSGGLGELAVAGADGAVGLDQLLDMPVHVSVEVGRSRVKLGELCRLGAGSMLKLDRKSHQPVDILVNGKVVARGEIVTINDSYGVRITDVEG